MDSRNEFRQLVCNFNCIGQEKNKICILLAKPLKAIVNTILIYAICKSFRIQPKKLAMIR